MKKLLFFLAVLLFTNCAKEPEPEFTTVKPIQPIEGRYNGRLTMHCKRFSYNVDMVTNVNVTSFNAEDMAVSNYLGTFQANRNGLTYTGDLEYIDVTDCGQWIAVYLQISGRLESDSLIENGSFYIYTRYTDSAYFGTYHYRGTKQN